MKVKLVSSDNSLLYNNRLISKIYTVDYSSSISKIIIRSVYNPSDILLIAPIKDIYVNGKTFDSVEELTKKLNPILFQAVISKDGETIVGMNYTQSTQGSTGTPFPSNPKVGDYFSYIDDEGNIEEVYQYDGDTWKLFIRHKINFEIMFNDESFMHYNDIGKLQNFVGYDNYSISKFEIDENNLTISASLTAKKSNPESIYLIGVTEIIKANKDQTKISPSFTNDMKINDGQVVFQELNIGQLTIDPPPVELKKLIVRNCSINSFSYKNRSHILEELLVENNESPDINTSIDIGAADHIILRNNGELNLVSINAFSQKSANNKYDVKMLDLSNQKISQLQIYGLDTINLKELTLPTIGSFIRFSQCLLTKQFLDELYNHMIKQSPIAIYFDSCDNVFSKEQQVQLKEKGYTITIR